MQYIFIIIHIVLIAEEFIKHEKNHIEIIKMIENI